MTEETETFTDLDTITPTAAPDTGTQAPDTEQLPAGLAKKLRRAQALLYTAIALVLVFAFSAATIALYRQKLHHPAPYPLTGQRAEELAAALAISFPQGTLSALPYATVPVTLPVQAESVIVADARTGSVLFEKNADEPIPPASMTKLVVMYVTEHAVAQGLIGYDDEVPLSPASWAVNQPPDSSLMFLGEGQRVTLDELLKGLAVPSGNDAAYAVAEYVSGSVESFVDEMNRVVAELGLTETRFVEPSGYSAGNMTTARDFIAFCKIYISEHPESLARYHSLPEFSYPEERNLPDGMAPGEKTGSWYIKSAPVKQKNTNRALGLVEGADGLKTGYIEESGYNLALTAEQNGSRFISVTMRGPGATGAEGNRIRAEDGKVLMEWAFGAFTTAPVPRVEERVVTVLGGKTEKGLVAKVLLPDYLTVPHIGGVTRETAPDAVPLVVQVSLGETVAAPVAAGDIIGSADILLRPASGMSGTSGTSGGDTVLARLPVVADRSVAASNALVQWLDRVLY